MTSYSSHKYTKKTKTKQKKRQVSTITQTQSADALDYNSKAGNIRKVNTSIRAVSYQGRLSQSERQEDFTTRGKPCLAFYGMKGWTWQTPVSKRTSVRICFGSTFSSKFVVCGHCLVTLSLTINETLNWLSSLPILMQESFWW